MISSTSSFSYEDGSIFSKTNFEMFLEIIHAVRDQIVKLFQPFEEIFLCSHIELQILDFDFKFIINL